ncbi:2'-5' RNA ligase family protein (plasmid) [Catenovulum sp. SX2]|uniref:2'-5' RNA ligase family protein n=1 Tax=Catenovulum sp. SX2 TaxID=3398614 RepID=UPI003F83650E
MAKQIYEQMWQSFEQALVSNSYQLDKLINDSSDSRRGITALAYIQDNNQALAQEINQFIQKVARLEPSQYYYPTNELHLTLLSVISCIAGFELTEVNVEAYRELFIEVMRDCAPISIEFVGITASPSSIVIQGFPVGNGLQLLREKLRKALQASGLRTTFDTRYKLVAAHITAVRFCNPLEDNNKLLSLCKSYRSHSFGTVTFKQFDLVFNNWYQNLSVTKSLAKYEYD